jgi:hypothetical protein
MKEFSRVGDTLYKTKSECDLEELVLLIELVSKDYSFETVDRRPHLTMEFPTFFNKKDSISSVRLRSIILKETLPAIESYMLERGLEYMQPKKTFITISKLLPGLGMAPHVDNADKTSNHFICMFYINENFSGGELVFPNDGLKYKPEAGDILIYRGNNLHQVLPVTSGIRYSIGYGLLE